MPEEYEIFPHKLLEDLKYDVEALKKKLTAPDTASQELVVEMEDLKSTIKELNNVFKEALEDIKNDDSAKLLKTLQTKIGTVVTQNETIARGMIAISDKLEEFMKNSSLREIRPQQSFSPSVSRSSGMVPPLPPIAPPQRRTGIFK